jgi:hypothetical protein
MYCYRGVAYNAMRRNDYPIHMNCDYTHGLGNAELCGRLKELVAGRLLTARWQCFSYRRDRRFWFFTLTHAGGTQWECERQSNWERYIVARSESARRTGSRFAEIKSPCRTTAEAYLDFRSSYWTGGNIVRETLFDEYLVPWRSFSEVHRITVEGHTQAERADRPPSSSLLRREESCRSWWRNIRQMMNMPE